MGQKFNGEKYRGFVAKVAEETGVYGNAVANYGNAIERFHNTGRLSRSFVELEARFARESLKTIGVAGGANGMRQVNGILEVLDQAELAAIEERPNILARLKRNFR